MDENHRIANDFENLLVIGDDDNHNRQENASQVNTSCENCGHREKVRGRRDLNNLDNDIINLNEIENRHVGNQEQNLGRSNSNVLSQVVNRQKNTEEDIERSGIDHQFVSTSTTKNNGFSLEHLGRSNVLSEVVNRQKNTKEDIECSGSDHQFTQTNTTKNNGSPQINHHFQAWKLLLNVHSCTQKAILDHLNTSEHCILWNNTVVFGRGEEVNFFINDEATSRNHVELVGHILSDGQAQFMIRNASSKKMIYFNKQRIKSNSKWIPLKTGDEIAISGLVFTVHIVPGTFHDMFSIQFDLPKVYGTSIVNPSYSNIKYKTCNHETNVLPEMQVPVSPHQSYHYPQPYPNLADHTRETPREEPINMEISFEMVQNAFKPYEGKEGYIDLANLQYIALEVVGEWKELGRVLGLFDWLVIIIDNDYRKIAEKSYQMMKTWVYLKPHEATLENLGSALKHLTVERRDLAEKYCNIAVQSRGERNGHN
ncbi:uncharacterized protein LOC124448908 isoform X3 [Xenia sp. Carnegie-2017]|uniref:uncharacterized protein LOC124448908 isoform X2 n=1 Tax=Xenia sp. Carnegie-2017 TaxID=2897299 RepID=UPI001F03A2A3|nr:uncharacterized protein LOC124448908 isoform X2 [Xenia sp. Carnegie-2017]XP_046855817.1 uncharacterized protein LOC124448908 isoform X3 [Xenia sp. Carnegie-2017]